MERGCRRHPKDARVAQPQLSVWIRRLEEDLGVSLFDRSSRSVRLTESGYAVREPILQTLAGARLIRRSAVLGSSRIVGQVNIGYAGASSREVLPPLARAVRLAEPGIELKLTSLVYGGSAPTQVAAGVLDIAFSRLPVRNEHVNVRVFAYERLLAVLPSDHPLASQGELDVRDLADEPFVTFPATQGSTVRDASFRLALESGFVPQVVQEAPDSYAILSMVAAGAGVTLTLSSVSHIDRPGLVYRQLSGTPTYLATVIVSARHNLSRAAGAVIGIMEDIFPTPEPPAGRVLQ
ncbi:LysR substrate-binding domain-containing protein [Micrococcaceae bacterium Sec7.4]